MPVRLKFKVGCWVLGVGIVIFFLILAPNSSLITIYAAPSDTPDTSTSGTPASSANYTPYVHTGFTLKNALSNVTDCMIRGKTPNELADGTSSKDQCGITVNGKLLLYDSVPGGGALGGISTVMTAMYNNPPVSSKEYLADLGTNLGLVKPAYAQVAGSGNSVIAPILDLWRVSRNMAYLAFILIFIVVGLMIMFRQKLNPQTVISIQQALPGLVVGLILVTFSYFIAALIIDFSFVAMKLVAFLFIQSGLPNIIANGDELASKSNIIELYSSFIQNDSLRSNIVAPIANYFQEGVFSWLDPAVKANEPFSIFTINPSQIIQSVVSSAAYVAGGTVGFLLSALIMIALFIQMIRLLWALISAYISVLVFSIAGPVLIAIGSIPGRGSVIGYWWKTLLANVLIFPAVFATFLFAGIFLYPGNVGSTATGTPFTTLPWFAGLQPSIVKALIGYGIVLGSPAIPGLVKQAMGVKDITAIQQQAFAGLAAGYTPIKAGGQRAFKPWTTRWAAGKEAMLRRYYAEVESEIATSSRPNIGGRGLGGFLFRAFVQPKIDLQYGKTLPNTSGQQAARTSSTPSGTSGTGGTTT